MPRWYFSFPVSFPSPWGPTVNSIKTLLIFKQPKSWHKLNKVTRIRPSNISLGRWLTKGHVSSLLFFIYKSTSSSTERSPGGFELQRSMWTALPPGRTGNTTDVSTYHITVVKCRGRIHSLFWCLLNKAAWDCSPSPCGLSSRVQGIWVTHCTSGFPPGGPGTGRGRLTNCKGFNWAAHKLFSLHKGIGSNKCHKPIMR